jgi:aspartate aminotransferase-like enzyme
MKKIKPYALFTPGPTTVPGVISQKMTKPLIYHREEKFQELYLQIVDLLKKLFVTEGRVFVLTASGTGAMEAAVTNLVNRNQRVLVLSCGKFGERWREILFRYGIQVKSLTAPYGKVINPTELERQLKSDDAIKFVFTTLTETSTGALLDIKSFGEICYRLSRHLVVDCIAGLGADEFYMDNWHVDVACGATQKALGLPPGLSFIALSNAVWEKVKECRTPRYYFDLRIADRFWDKHQTPWTPAISLFYPLLYALQKINNKGLETSFKRYQKISQLIRTRVTQIGFEIFPEVPSCALTVIKMPEPYKSSQLLEYLKTKYHILFANGQGELRDRIIRIGHMGHFTIKDFLWAMKALKNGYQKLLAPSKK